MFRLLSLLIIAALVGLSSCKKDENNDPAYCSTAWASDVQDELAIVTNAAMTYVQDPTTQNCDAYKAAFQDYIEALEPYENCSLWTVQQKAEWQAVLDEARDDLDTLCD
jgi:hypothetical protein